VGDSRAPSANEINIAIAQSANRGEALNADSVVDQLFGQVTPDLRIDTLSAAKTIGGAKSARSWSVLGFRARDLAAGIASLTSRVATLDRALANIQAAAFESGKSLGGNLATNIRCVLDVTTLISTSIKNNLTSLVQQLKTFVKKPTRANSDELVRRSALPDCGPAVECAKFICYIAGRISDPNVLNLNTNTIKLIGDTLNFLGDINVTGFLKKTATPGLLDQVNTLGLTAEAVNLADNNSLEETRRAIENYRELVTCSYHLLEFLADPRDRHTRSTLTALGTAPPAYADWSAAPEAESVADVTNQQSGRRLAWTNRRLGNDGATRTDQQPDLQGTYGRNDMAKSQTLARRNRNSTADANSGLESSVEPRDRSDLSRSSRIEQPRKGRTTEEEPGSADNWTDPERPDARDETDSGRQNRLDRRRTQQDVMGNVSDRYPEPPARSSTRRTFDRENATYRGRRTGPNS
jgi:hypothetical protein